MDNQKFEKLVLEIAENLPDKFKTKLENVGLVIDNSDLPQKGRLVLGLYQGLPSTRKPGKRQIFPDKITLYKKAIEKVSKTPEDLKNNIKRVILHEIGHHFGLNEDRLRKLGY